MNSDYYRRSTYSYKESYEGDVIDYLNINPQEFKKKAIEQGITCEGAFPNLKHRTGKEVVSIDAFITELLNNSSTSLFIFIFEMCVDDAVEFFKQLPTAKYLKVAKGTMGGLFSDWQGGGSCLECFAIRDSKLKIKRDKFTDLRIGVEPNTFRYSVDEVFGFCSGVLSKGGLQLI